MRAEAARFFAAQVGKQRRRAVGDLLLGHDGGVDAVLQIFVRRQRVKVVIKHRLRTDAVGVPLGKRADDPQRLADIQQLAQRQHGARRGTAQRICGVFERAEGRAAEARHQAAGGVGLVEQALGLFAVGNGDKLTGQLCGIRTAGLFREQLEHLVQLQCDHIAIHSVLL